MPSGSEEPQRDPALKRKAWLAVFLVSTLFWVVVALRPGNIGVEYGSDGTFRNAKTSVSTP